MMHRLSRIIGVVVVGALPLYGGLYLGWQTTAQMDAARREAEGVRYAGLVLPELVGLARDGALPAADSGLAQAVRSGDALFGTASLSRAYKALKSALAAGAHPAAARHAAAMLVQRIHDSSGRWSRRSTRLSSRPRRRPAKSTALPISSPSSRASTDAPPERHDAPAGGATAGCQEPVKKAGART